MHEPTPREKALTRFPEVYLTLVSVVQAIALEVLVARMVAIRPQFSLTAEALIVWLEVVLLALTIFYGWVSYTLLVTLAQWVLRAFDFAAAFSVGIMQFVAIGFIGPGSFTAFCSMVAVGFGFGAFVSHSNTGVAARRAENLAVMRSMPRRRLTFLLALVAFCGLAGALAAGASKALVLAALAACNLTVVVALREWFEWWNRVVGE